MKPEYDFSNAEQRKFYHPNVTFHYPIYLEPDVDNFLHKIAEEKNIDVQILVNELLRNNIKDDPNCSIKSTTQKLDRNLRSRVRGDQCKQIKKLLQFRDLYPFG